MANFMDKDPYTYQKEKEGFLKELKLFHASRGTPLPGFPTVRGKEVDLYLLHHKVAGLGGCEKVNDNQQWEEIQEYFHIPIACCNAGQCLKNIYVRYLAAYVKGPEHNDYEDDDESRRNRQKRSQHIANVVPQKYNYHQHNVSDYVRKEAGMATEFVEENEYRKLENALLSGLPNEVDFAINVCTLLSNEGKRTIRVARCKRLVHLLLAHGGIFSHGPKSLYKLYEEHWRPTTGRNYLKFWHDSVNDEEIRELIDPSSLLEDKVGVMDKALVTRLFEEGSNHLTEDVLHLGRELGVHDVEGQRILQVMMILRNISFEEENMSALASDPLVFRFLLLCIHSKYSTLRQLALDTLGNIALQMVLGPIDYRTTQLVLQTVTRCLASRDRFHVVRGMEILSRLCQVEANEELLSENLETRVYEDVVHMLTVQDIQLIVYTLECLYQLSELGDLTSSHIAGIRGAVETLVSLTTVEAQSYGPQSLMGIKVVEHVPAGVVAAQQQQQQTAANMGPPASHPRHVASSQRPLAVATPPPPHAQRLTVVPTPPSSSRPVQAQQLVPHQSSAVEPEAMACNWLKAHFEICQGIAVLRMEMYADYLASCSRSHIRHLNNINTFANCIRIVFPKVDTVRSEKDDGTIEVHLKGIKKRQVPLPFPPQFDHGASSPLHTLQTRPPTPNTMLATPPAPHTSSGRPVSRRLIPGPVQPSRPVAPAQRSQSVLQQQLNSPPLPSQLQISHSETVQQKDPLNPPFPTIQQALVGQQSSPPLSIPPVTIPIPQEQASTPHVGAPGVPAFPGARHNRPPDSNLIKSLLANKVTKNMHKMQLQQQQQQQQQQHQLPPGHSGLADAAQGGPRSVIGTLQQAPQQVLPQQQVPLQSAVVQQLEVPAAETVPLQQVAAVTSVNSTVVGIIGQEPSVVEQRVPDIQPSSSNSLSSLNTETETVTPADDKSSHLPCLPVNRPPSRRRSGSPGSSPVQPSTPNSPRPGSPGRAKSPKGGRSPQSKSPKPPGSPHTQAMILEVCSHAERAGDVVRQEGHHVAQIERVENLKKNDISQAQIEKIEDVQNLEDQEAKIERVENTYVTLLQEEVKKQVEHIDGGMDNRVQPVPTINSQVEPVSPNHNQDISVTEIQPNTGVNNALTETETAVDKGSQGVQHVSHTLPTPGVVDSNKLLETVPKEITADNQDENSGLSVGIPHTKNTAMSNCVTDHVVHGTDAVLVQEKPPQSPVLESRPDISVMSTCPRSPLVNGTNSDSSSSQCDLASVQSNNPANNSHLPPHPINEPVASVSPKKDMATDVCKRLEEIEEKKARLAQYLDDKQVFVFNGMVNHIGNGDCHLPFKKDEMSLLKEKDVDRTYEKGTLVVESQDSAVQTQGCPDSGNVVLSNGYASPQPEDSLCEESKKSVVASALSLGSSNRSDTLPCQAPKSVIDCVSNQTRTNSQDQVNIEPMDIDQSQTMPSTGNPTCIGTKHLEMSTDVVMKDDTLSESDTNKISNVSVAPVVGTAPGVIASSQSQEINSQPVRTVVDQTDIKLTGCSHHNQVISAGQTSVPVQHCSASQTVNREDVGMTVHNQTVVSPGTTSSMLLKPGLGQTVYHSGPPVNEVSDSSSGTAKTKVSMTIAELLQHRAVTRQPVPPSQGNVAALPLSQQNVTVTSVQTFPAASSVRLSNPQVSPVQESSQPTATAQHHQQLAASLAAPLSVRATMLPPTQVSNSTVMQQPRMASTPVTQTMSQVAQGQPIIAAALQGPNKIHIGVAVAGQSGLVPATVTFTTQPPTQPNTMVVRAPLASIAVGPIIRPPVITTPPPISPVEVKSPVLSPGQKRPATNITPREQGAKKKKSLSRNNSIDSRRSSTQSQPSCDYMCEWQGCRKCFESAKAVSAHVLKTHHSKQALYGVCQWEGCDGLRRQRWSLVTHFQDKHLTEHVLKAASLRRQQVAASGASPAPPVGTPNIPPPVYPVDAAYQAIRRFSPRPPYPEFMEVKEGPVTKHIRLTSALILRNLARYSALGRSLLKKHEENLAYIALSSLEASTALAHCLHELKDKHHGPPNPHAVTHYENSA